MRLVMAGLSAIGLVATGAYAVAAPSAKGHTHATFSAGAPGNPKRPFRVIDVKMGEGDGKMFYVPDRIEVQRGEQIKFVIRNEGGLKHEFMLDTVAANAKHAIAMQKNPEMQHDDPNGKQAEPSKTVEMLWRFTKVGSFEFACLIPGHYEAGMKGVVVVTSRKARKAAAK